MRIIPKRRRSEKKTDYNARISLLSGYKPRVVFRKTNSYIIGQMITSKEAQDKIVVGVTSKDLLKFGWPEKLAGSLKSLPAAYLTGLLLGKKIVKEKQTECIFDLGLLRSLPKTRIYAFLKGVIDAGVKIPADKKMFPEDKRIKGEHLKNDVPKIFDKVKSEVEKVK